MMDETLLLRRGVGHNLTHLGSELDETCVCLQVSLPAGERSVAAVERQMTEV
jgi:hypothetical protein